MALAKRYSVGDFRRGYGVVDPNGKEVISFSFWERLTYVSAATLTLTAFQTAPVNPEDGNLTGQGQLDNGNAFLVMAIRVAPAPNVTETAAAAPTAGNADGALQDVQLLVHGGSLEFTVGPKRYGRWPLWELPAAGGPYGFIASPGTLTAPASQQFQVGTNGFPDIRNAYSLPVPIAVPPLFSFRATLNWRAAQTLTNGNTPIYVVLDGLLMRPVQ